MSVEITDNAIKMTRGDTLRCRVTPYTLIRDEHGEVIGKEDYTPVEGDVIRFAVKHTDMKSGKQYKDEQPIILKTVPNNTLLLELEPIDTKSLDFGTYVYDMEITYNDGSVYTFIDTKDFVLTPEVH